MRKIWSLVLMGLTAYPVFSVAQPIIVDVDALRPLLSPSELSYQIPGLDLNFSGGGASARGMSGAFVAVSGNLSAIGFNPAGLATLDRPQTALVYRYNRPGVRNRQFIPGAGSPGFDQNSFDNFDQIDFGGVAAPGKIWGRPVVGAFAYSVLSDQFFANRLITLAPVTVDDTLLQIANFDLSRQTVGKLSGFDLGIATRVGWLSVGTTFQIYQGGFSDTTELVFGPAYVAPSNGVDTAHILPVIARTRLGNKVSYRGSSLIVGAQADYKKARLGLSARIPAFTLGETDLFRLKSNMDIGFYDSVFVSGLYRQDLSSEDRLFFTDSRLELPLSLSAGLSYRFGRSLLADFDYTYTNWGAADLKTRRVFFAPFSNPATLVLGNAPIGLSSTHQLRLGWEVEFNPGFGQISVRGGIRNLPVRTLTSLGTHYYPYLVTVKDQLTNQESTYTVIDPSFIPEFKDSFVIDAQGNVIDTISTVSLRYYNGREDPAARGKIWQQFGASLGFGVRWNQVALDMAYDYTTFRRNSYNLTLLEGELTTSHQVRHHRFFVSFTGYFTRL